MSLLKFSVEDLEEIITLKKRDEKLKKEIDVNQKILDEMIEKQKADCKERGEIQDILNNFTDYKRRQKNSKLGVKSPKHLKVGDKFWYKDEYRDLTLAAKIEEINEDEIKITYMNIKGSKVAGRWRTLGFEDFNKLCKHFDKSDSKFDELYEFDPTGWKLDKLYINKDNIEFNGAGLPNAYLKIANSLNIKYDQLINNIYESIKCAREEFKNSRSYEYPRLEPNCYVPIHTPIHIMGISNEHCMRQILKMIYNDEFEDDEHEFKMEFTKGEEERTIYL